ncbi:MAG: DUF454 domain-containing protein [Firmicutes bacterium]|nr:DUF454 domain-containing protein [Bacillota bacterium]
MKRILLIIIGSISLVFGIIGIILPIIPTTPFLLFSLFVFMKSSKKLYDFILSNKYLGPYVQEYVSGKGVSMKSKKKAIFLIWITIGFSIVFVIDKIILRLMLIVIAVTVSTYIWTRKTLKVDSYE